MENAAPLTGDDSAGLRLRNAWTGAALPPAHGDRWHRARYWIPLSRWQTHRYADWAVDEGPIHPLNPPIRPVAGVTEEDFRPKSSMPEACTTKTYACTVFVGLPKLRRLPRARAWQAARTAAMRGALHRGDE